jgi:predicted RNase H-like HicB family nuclease
MATYIAWLHKEERSEYGVSFPDFPGCVAAGSTLEEARKLAAEALEFHIQGMIEDGEAVPEPSLLDAVAERPEAKDAIVFLVSVSDPEPTYVRVNVTVPGVALREIDRFAEDRGISRSQLFTESALAVAQGRVARGRHLPGREGSLHGNRGWPLKEKGSTATRTGKQLAPRGHKKRKKGK